MAVTRINNNQITDASQGNVYVGINANTKLQNYSITSQKIANNLTYGSDLTVTGNLTVNGTSTTIDTTITTIEDPVIVLASTQTGTPAVDIGFLGERGSANNIAFVWNEANSEFVTAFTSTDETTTTIDILAYANLHTNNMIVGGTTSLIGNVVGAANFTDTVTGGNLATGGNISATGNVTANYFIGNISGNITGAGSNTQVQFNDNGVTNATSGFTFDKTANLVTVGGNVNAQNFNGNVYGTDVSASGTVTAASTVGGVITGSSSSVTGTQTAASTVGGVITGSSSSVTGTQTAASTVGGVITGSSVSVTGGVDAASVAGGVITGTSTSVTGSQTAASTVGGVITGSSVSVTGNVTGGNLVSATVTNPTALTVSTNAGNINLEPTGNVVINNTYINGLQLTPIQDADAASKYYVDTIATTGITIHEAVVAATISDLDTATGGTVTYDQPNGAANGVGATLTTTGSFNFIDTANVQTVGTRILVKNQANAVQNGVYVFSNVSAITRSSDADQYGSDNAESFSINDYFFTTSGNVNAGTAFVVNDPTGVITFGTSNIGFGIFSSTQVYSANTSAGLSLVGTVFSAKVDNNTTAFDGLGNISVKAGANLTTPNIGAATGTSLSVTGTVTAASTVGGVITGSSASIIGNITGGNISTSGSGGAISGTGDITGGNINTSGNVSATGNVMASWLIGNIQGNISAAGANTDVIFNDNGVANATSGFTFNKDSNTVVVSGNVDAQNFNGNVYGTDVSASGNVTAGDVSATGNVTGGNVIFGTGIVSGSGNITSGNITTAGTLQGGNIVISGDDITDTTGRVNFNTAGADVDFAVNGNTVANVFYIDAVTGTASFGSNTQTTNSIVAFNATNSVLMPVGNTAQRPAGVTGQLRFNTSVNSLEVYNNAEWATVGQPDFTLITDQQFNGDGVTTVFTLSGNTTTAGSIVSINGIQQIPVTAYAASGTTLTFTEAPAVGDLIDVRILTTTTSVNSISNSAGTAVVAVQDGSSTVAVTGDLSVSGSILGGNINSTAITNGTSNMSVVASGGNIRANVAGTTVQTISPGLVAITGDLTVSGNATLSGNILGDRIQNGSTQIDIQTPSGNANITIGGTSNTAVFSSSALTLATNLLPSANVTYDLGSTTQRWKDLWLSGTTINLGGATISANATAIVMTNPAGGQTVMAGASGSSELTGTTVSVTGTVTAASVVGGVITGSSTSVTGNVTAGNLTVGTGTVTAGNIVNGNANGVGNIGSSTTYFNTVFAKATSAQYADLAEKYTADAEYAPGTVVSFGGTAEVTLAATDADRKVAGVVSTNPSYIMNSGLESDHVATVALTGRVPCQVVGLVKKGDLMVAAGNGKARAEADPTAGSIIGKALADSEGDAVIEVVVGRF